MKISFRRLLCVLLVLVGSSSFLAGFSISQMHENQLLQNKIILLQSDVEAQQDLVNSYEHEKTMHELNILEQQLKIPEEYNFSPRDPPQEEKSVRNLT